MTSPVSRRDFLNGVLIGSGAALLAARAPAAIQAEQGGAFAPSGSPWTGYGGVGDYRWSNGNTAAVRDAAHGIRDHQYPDGSNLPVSETYDLIVVGGGFSGMAALYEFNKQRKPGQSALLLDNHPVIGGEAKQNDFDVDGRRLVAPQGSNAGLVIKPTYQKGSYGGGRYDTYADYWRELQMPDHFELEPVGGGAQAYNLATEHFDAMFLERQYSTGYFFADHGWVRNPAENQFKGTPWSAEVQKQLDDFVNNRRDAVSDVKDVDRWLDSITYDSLLEKLGYGAEVKSYVDPMIAVGNFGVCSNAISGYAAKRLTLPGTIPSHERSRFENVEVVSFPGGNAAILRRMLKRIIPDSIAGDDSLVATTQGALNFAALDRAGQPARIRLGSTAFRVQHEGKPADASHVLVVYAREGKLYKVRARAVVMGSGGWVTRNVVADLTEAQSSVYKQFHYAPVLVANVALRNWRFFDKLKISVARSFAGIGWHVVVRRNVALEKGQPPLTPDSPVVLTFYIPFLHPKEDPSVQGSLGRAQLLATSYSDFEQQLRDQLSQMFGAAGFDARRDMAAVVLNRWGHAYFTPPLNFFFGQPGKPAAHEVLRQPHGRVLFAHSELQGNMNMAHAMLEGRRGALQALELIKG